MKQTANGPTLGSGGKRARKQLEAMRVMLGEIATHLKADFTVELWNGDRVPLKEGARDDLVLAIASPNAVRKLLLKPNLVTLLQLVAGQDIRLNGGSPYQFIERWNHGDAVHLLKRIDRLKMARHALPFIIGGNIAAKDLPGYTKDAGATYEERDDKELISFHYDVSNAFFKLFLDENLLYSSAYYRSEDDTLEEAQLHKMDMICRKLRLKPGDRLLDIGCGWGSLACHAAKHYGAHVHGLTLSKEQLAHGQEKVREMGLQDLVTLELKDYRELADQREVYDKISQVEMFEHVGWENFDRHFEIIRRLLKPKGIHYHQATTRRGGRDLKNFRKQTRSMEFITTYIFPGGELDYVGNTITNMGRIGLEVMDVECLREHFFLTLKAWEERLAANREAAVKEAGEARTSLWQIYFALFIKGFERGASSNYAITAVKRQPGRTALPLDRSALYYG
ncbi:SAM-dependent methyltransferase [Parvularcula lutaonensis]|uniref:Class I SAM-dependent methyltransferase n=1 Tax=Parvularcula lutaonensis TaxID=491923 RepID=A0ABV7MEJ4_9PROT|nr:cyclopropane-fatty-acyl-phospholipid synthase family protein [Parvularcula lutaonensis]GGY39801.1 cyclopropane-fatty-acyl-phospholipid synthase [Parvularcula lutaonensis]